MGALKGISSVRVVAGSFIRENQKGTQGGREGGGGGAARGGALKGNLPVRVVAGSFMMAKVIGHLKESGTSGESSKWSGTIKGGGQWTSLCL